MKSVKTIAKLQAQLSTTNTKLEVKNITGGRVTIRRITPLISIIVVEAD